MPSKNLDKNNLQIRHNASLVKKLYPNISRAQIQNLKDLTRQFSFSFPTGDVILLDNGWFVTHTGLIRLARRKRCRGIHVEAVDSLCDSAANRFVPKATVCPSKESAGFVSYGDADPSNVSSVGPWRRDAHSRNPSGRSRSVRLVKSFPSLVCVSRLASAGDRCPPPFVPRRAREGTRFVDSSSGAPVARVLRSSLSGWLVFGSARGFGVRSFTSHQNFSC